MTGIGAAIRLSKAVSAKTAVHDEAGSQPLLFICTGQSDRRVGQSVASHTDSEAHIYTSQLFTDEATGLGIQTHSAVLLRNEHSRQTHLPSLLIDFHGVLALHIALCNDRSKRFQGKISSHFLKAQLLFSQIVKVLHIDPPINVIYFTWISP